MTPVGPSIRSGSCTSVRRLADGENIVANGDVFPGIGPHQLSDHIEMLPVWL